MRILLVEDEALLAASVARFLESQGHTVTTVADGRDAVHIAATSPVEAVLLDLTLPGLDGLEVLRQVRARDPSLPVLVMTARSAVGDRVAGLDLGADDYIVKPVALEELGARLRSRVRSRTQPHASVIELGSLRIDLAGRRVWRRGSEVRLTVREFDLLVQLARHRGQVLSRDQLLSAVWDVDHDSGTRVVEVYVGYLRRKLALPSAPELIETVRNAGYRLTADAG